MRLRDLIPSQMPRETLMSPSLTQKIRFLFTVTVHLLIVTALPSQITGLTPPETATQALYAREKQEEGMRDLFPLGIKYVSICPGQCQEGVWRRLKSELT